MSSRKCQFQEYNPKITGFFWIINQNIEVSGYLQRYYKDKGTARSLNTHPHTATLWTTEKCAIRLASPLQATHTYFTITPPLWRIASSRMVWKTTIINTFPLNIGLGLG